MPLALHHLNAVAAGGRVYVLGGLRLDFAPVGDDFVYHPAVDRWTASAVTPWDWTRQPRRI